MAALAEIRAEKRSSKANSTPSPPRPHQRRHARQQWRQHRRGAESAPHLGHLPRRQEIHELIGCLCLPLGRCQLRLQHQVKSDESSWQPPPTRTFTLPCRATIRPPLTSPLQVLLRSFCDPCRLPSPRPHPQCLQLPGSGRRRSAGNDRQRVAPGRQNIHQLVGRRRLLLCFRQLLLRGGARRGRQGSGGE